MDFPGYSILALFTSSLICAGWAQTSGAAGGREARDMSSVPRLTAPDFEKDGPKPGEKAPDFQLKTLEGKSVRLSDLWAAKPTLIMTGSYTCPVFRNRIREFEKLAKDFGDQLNCLVVYTVEAHPKGDPSPYRSPDLPAGKREWVTRANEEKGVLHAQPETMEERVALAKTAAKDLDIGVPVAVDTMDGSAWKAYGRAPNCAYLIDASGTVAAQHGWFNYPTMRESIAALPGIELPAASQPASRPAR
jgi:hypothetical protein